MAAGKLHFKSDAGGITSVSREAGAINGELVLPASGTVVSVAGTVTDNAIARYDSTTGKLQNSGVVIDDSGNVGIGVTPSAWGNYIKALDISYGTAIINIGSYVGSAFAANCYYNAGWKYKNNEVASLYEQNGTHNWKIAPSGTAGNAITWTNAMTLSNSGNLLVGTTTDNGVDKLQVNGTISSGPIPGTLVDVNTLKYITRTYVISSSSANIPIVDYGYLEVIVHSEDDWAMQRFTCLGTNASYAGRTFVRCFINGTTWTGWAEK